jgi:pSer/pThr/pTyr-binding forkhead associated (FHA) protein
VIQLLVLSGKLTGKSWVARRFPVRIGRSASSDLRLEEAGVWNEHLVIDLNSGKSFSLTVQPDAIASVNAKPTTQALLRNGDTIELGVVKLQFWLDQARQKSLRLREAFIWVAFLTVTLGEVVLVYWLLR